MNTAQEAARDLRGLHNRYGSRFMTDGTFCASVVKDCIMPKLPLEAPLLAEAVSRGVVDKIGKVGKGRKAQDMLSLIVTDLALSTGCDEATASWVVSVWAITLGVVNSPIVVQSSSISAPPPPFPGPRVSPPTAFPPLPGGITLPSTQLCRSRRASRVLGRLFVIGLVVAGFMIGVRERWWRYLTVWFDAQSNRCPPLTERVKSDVLEASDRQPFPEQSQPETPRPAPPEVPAESWAPATRPHRVSAAPNVDLSSMSITILGNDISFNGQRIGHAELQSLLERAAQEDKNRSIEILYDENRETGQLNEVKGMCRKAGLRRFWVKPVDTR